jgi:membrane protein DedA with SNARE-associated domain
VETASSRAGSPSRRTLTLIIVPILAVIVAGNVGNLFHAPLLKEHPMWLVALEPRNRFLLLVAQKGVSFWPFLAVAAARRLISDPLFYLLGRLYRDRAVRWMERKMGEGGGVVRVIERAFNKAAPVMVFVLPGLPVCVLAGATGMSPVLFAALNVAGTITMVTLMYQLSDVLDGPLGAINRFYANNTRTLFIITFVALGLYLVTQYLQGRGELRSVSSIEKELAGDDAGGGDVGTEESADEADGEGRPSEAEQPKDTDRR